jgi:hypothetical protein
MIQKAEIADMISRIKVSVGERCSHSRRRIFTLVEEKGVSSALSDFTQAFYPCIPKARCITSPVSGPKNLVG